MTPEEATREGRQVMPPLPHTADVPDNMVGLSIPPFYRDGAPPCVHEHHDRTGMPWFDPDVDLDADTLVDVCPPDLPSQAVAATPKSRTGKRASVVTRPYESGLTAVPEPDEFVDEELEWEDIETLL